MLAFKCEEKVLHVILRKDWLQFKQKENSPGPNDSWSVIIEEQPFCSPQHSPFLLVLALPPPEFFLWDQVNSQMTTNVGFKEFRMKTHGWISGRAFPWCSGITTATFLALKVHSQDTALIPVTGAGWSAFLQGPKRRMDALYWTLSYGLGEFYMLFFQEI